MNRDLQKFKIVSEFAPIHIIFTDTEGKVLYANKAVEDITGYSKTEIIGNNPRLWGRQMKKNFYQKLWKTIKFDRKIFEGEIKNKRKNGDLYIAQARIAPVLENDKLIGFVGIERDITKEKQIDQAKSEFVSLASHQLKNPLSVIGLYTSALLQQKIGKLNEKQKKYIQSVNRASKKMNNLITSLLNINKIELGKFVDEPKVINLSKTIKDVIKEFTPKIEEKSIILKEYSPDISILIDPKLITIVLQNLVSNAIKYTPEFGKVEVEVLVRNAEVRNGRKNQKSHNLILKSHFVRLNSDILIRVSDTGYGIPRSQQTKIFARLFRAENVLHIDPEGTGLGLYMVKSLIDKLNGKIWFESIENKGTTFFVEIPINNSTKK